MISSTDPESMTAEECQREVAGILAQGLLRRARMLKTDDSTPRKIVSKGSRNCLDVPAETRLSVAQRPVG
jgi:hypothetical protein